jgi:hypothetical protein
MDDHAKLLMLEIQRKSAEKKRKTLESLGSQHVLSISRKQGLALRTLLGLSWFKYRMYKQFMSGLGVKHESECAERAAQAEAGCGALVIEKKNTCSYKMTKQKAWRNKKQR